MSVILRQLEIPLPRGSAWQHGRQIIKTCFIEWKSILRNNLCNKFIPKVSANSHENIEVDGVLILILQAIGLNLKAPWFGGTPDTDGEV